uniref:GIY-YIG domain-containing protein n=3 Tax=Acrobeloides nanus TaxID=290746 RepID=A0A914CCW2_9BILA
MDVRLALNTLQFRFQNYTRSRKSASDIQDESIKFAETSTFEFLDAILTLNFHMDKRGMSRTVSERCKTIQHLIAQRDDLERFMFIIFQNLSIQLQLNMDQFRLVNENFVMFDMTNKFIYAHQCYQFFKYLYVFISRIHLLSAVHTPKRINYNLNVQSVMERAKEFSHTLNSICDGHGKSICHLTKSDLVLTTLPLLLPIIQSFQPVNAQVFSKKDLQIISKIVALMAGYGLNYVQKYENNVADLHFDPGFDSLVCFPSENKQMESDSHVILERIEAMCLHFLQELCFENPPQSIVLSVPDEWRDPNVSTISQVRLLDSNEHRFSILMRALSQIYELLLFQKQATRYSLFYENKHLYGRRKNFNGALWSICNILGVNCDQLNVTNMQVYEDELGLTNRDARKYYENGIPVLEQQQFSIVGKREIPKYSDALERLLIAEERRENIEMGLAEENEIRNEFCMGLPITREKNEAAYFCYLLIDPSKIPSMQNCIFREFISAIFYVGKGKRSRPLQHLCDATKFRQKHVEQLPEKLRRILHLWDHGFGVISLHIFFNIHATEAFIREAAMILAMSRDNLTNVKKGEFYCFSEMWNSKQKEEFGARLFMNAYYIFKNERCRPLMENELGH